MALRSPSCTRHPRALLGPLAVMAVTLALFPRPADAIPAYARQFNVKCSTCHTPVPPRLNNVGITFKRMGFRMPDADEQGNLILKDKPSRSVFDDFSLVGDFRGEGSRGEQGRFKVDELMAIGGGAINTHLSYQGEVAYEDGEVMLETLEGQLLAGRPGRNLTARFGLMGPELWTKCNTQRLTVFRPALNHTPVPVGEFGGFTLHDRQLGVEVGLNLNHLGDGGMIRSTFLSVGLYDGLRQEEGEMGGLAFDERGFRDVVVQAVHLFGDSHSIAALWYHGDAEFGDEPFRNTTNRLTLMGNYRFVSGTDLLGGVNFGRDRSTEPDIERVSSRGWFAEINQALGSRTAALVRFDRFEPDRELAGVRIDGPTIGLTHHLLDNLLLNAEYRGLKTGSDVRGRDLVARIVVAY